MTGSDVGSETGTGANDGKAEVMDGIGGTWDGVTGIEGKGANDGKAEVMDGIGGT